MSFGGAMRDAARLNDGKEQAEVGEVEMHDGHVSVQSAFGLAEG
ncbi:hypothetical protein [Mesorhizobium sp. CCNWLY176]